MKHRILALILVLILALGLTMPAAALRQYDYLTMEIEDLDNERLQNHGLSILPTMSAQYGFDLRVEIIEAIEGEDLEERAHNIYDINSYGYGANADGSLLVIQVANLGSSVDIVDYTVIGKGIGSELLARSDSLLLFESLDMTLLGGERDYASAGSLCADAVDVYAGVMSMLLEQVLDITPSMESDQQEQAPIAAEEPRSYIADNAELLTEEEKAALEEQAGALAEEYGCGVYVLTVKTMAGAERRAFAEKYYTDRNLGLGDDRNGILFMISMDSRDYVTVTYGGDPADTAQYGIGIRAFTDAGIAAMEEEVVPMLTDGDYSGAFETYLDTCEDYLSYFAKHGEGKVPQEKGSLPLRLAIIVLVPLLIALVVCLVLRSQMKTAKPAATAREYIPQESFMLTAQRDHFVHTSRHTEKIQKSSGSGSGSTVSSSGFGGSKGGKF